MKVLVTGASGGVGVALRRRLDGMAEVFPHYLVGTTRIAAADIAVDVGDREALRLAIATTSPDVIVHLAGLTGAACDVDEERTSAVNVDSVVTLMAAARAEGVRRVIFSSSSSVYGDGYESPATEAQPLAPSSLYARSKVSGEEAVADGLTSGLDGISLRTFNVYGPRFVNSLVNRLRAATSESPVVLHGLDSFVRDYIHVDDVVEAIVASLTVATPSDYTVVNIGTGVPTSNRRLVELLGERQERLVRFGAEVTSYSCADIALAKQLFGLVPRDLSL